MKKLHALIPCLALVLSLFFQSCKTKTETSISVTAIPADGWKMPNDVDDLTVSVDSIPPSREEWLRFGWNSFVALNWPADNNWPIKGNGGKPAMNMNITDPGADSLHTVWQTYLEPGQLFLEKGADPGSWDDPINSVHTKSFEGKELPILGGFEEKGLYFLNQDPEVGLVLFDLAITPNPVIDQSNNYVLLESRFNQTEFEYFKRTGYCDACKQSADISNGTFEYLDSLGNNSLPEWARQGAVEIKASWKILVDGVDINSRYYTTKGYYLSPTKETLGPYTFGLVGLHILRNTPRSSKTWYWTTFEQVDNVKIYDTNPPKRPNGKALSASFNPGPAGSEIHYQYGYDIEGRFDVRNRFILSDSIRGNPVIDPPRINSGDDFPQANRRPVNCSRVTAIPDDIKKINKEFQAKLAGTPWEHYEMIDAMYPDPDPNTGIFELLKPNGEAHEPDKIFTSTPALINITMESYLAFKPAQWSIDNCLSCHYDAQPRSFGNDLGKSDANQVFSYLYRRALPKYPDTLNRRQIKRIITIINGEKSEEIDTTVVKASSFNCDSLKYMSENYR